MGLKPKSSARPKLKSYTRTCKKCSNFFNTPHRTARYCEKCKKIRREKNES